MPFGLLRLLASRPAQVGQVIKMPCDDDLSVCAHTWLAICQVSVSVYISLDSWASDACQGFVEPASAVSMCYYSFLVVFDCALKEPRTLLPCHFPAAGWQGTDQFGICHSSCGLAKQRHRRCLPFAMAEG